MAVYKDKNKTSDGRCWFFQMYKKNYNNKKILYKSKRYLTKHEAEEAEAVFLLKRDNPATKKFGIVANDFFDKLQINTKQSTVQTYKEVYDKHICPFFAGYDLNDINIPLINNYREFIQKNDYSPNYLNKINNVINKILDFAVINYGLPSNPNKVLPRFKLDNTKVIKDEDRLRYITYEEFKQFISVVDDLTYKTIFSTLYYTGLRKGELFALKFSDIQNDTIIVNKTLYAKIRGDYTITSTKNNQNRIVKMNKSLLELMNQYIAYMKSFTDYNDNWFLFGGTHYLSETTLNRYKHEYFVKSGLKNEITIHEFRHSAVSLLANEIIKKTNGDVDTTAFFLMMSKRFGHTPEVMQRTYMHFFKDNQDEIVNILDNL